MTTRQTLIDEAVRATGALAEDMTREVMATNPAANAALAAGLHAGERPVVVIEFSDSAPRIRLCLVDDYESLRQVMLIEGKASTRQ